jgi:hypothetical protein
VLERIRLRLLKRRLRGSLAADQLQPVGWDAWLDGAASRAEIARCSEPGWLVHVAFWSGVSAAALLHRVLEAAMRVVPTDGAESPASGEEWQRLEEAAREGEANRFAAKEALFALLVRLEDGLAAVTRAMTDAPDALSASDLDRHGPRAALALITLAAINVEDGQRAEAFQCLGRACSVLVRTFPPERERLTSWITAALDGAPDLPHARARQPPRRPARLSEPGDDPRSSGEGCEQRKPL